MAQVRIAIRLSSLGLPFRQALAAAASLGAKAIQIDAGTDVRLSELSTTGIRQLRKMITDFDLRLAAIRFQTRRGFDCADGLSRRIDATKDVMSIAYQLGGPLVINQIGNIPDSAEDPRYEGLASVISDLGRHGTRVGTFLAAETGTESGPALARLLQSDHNAFVAAALNPGKLIVNRFDLDEAVKALADRIQIVIASDGVLDLAAGRGVDVPLGQGTTDYPALLAQLEQQAFKGFFVVGDESATPQSPQRAADAIEYLQNM
ncbi:MAG TPA: xylose isomerase [Planctomycetaceae bacterium]|nr:xylose isomerase [Planctomycetaceae bacterium]